MKIREKRFENQLKQKELAERIGTNVPMLSNFERYICLPIPSMLKAMCREMKCDVLELYNYDELYVDVKKIHSHIVKALLKGQPSIYKLTVELPNDLREKLTPSNLEKCGYYSLKDFIWHCCKKFEKQLANIQNKEKTTQLQTAKVVERDNAIAK